ncbi:hypothetical protein F5148DRAFT_1277370 [Russula earlei]|uniref:Uncharacterized protein n=1 Tax=Russula earlei TaxID=71964 RepID=A0ACC0TYZ3_9AGAM|nr:hypothetical protein F5148DRAFT_1277370 [Russula earlei]
MSYTVNVSSLTPSTTEQQLHDYFSFCGSDEAGSAKSAVIHFEKPSAMKTALMLNGSILGGGPLVVHSDAVHPDEELETAHVPGAPLDQSDKPRAGIAAEYLAKGYQLRRGISSRFLNYFHSLDSSLGAKALGSDQTISGKVTSTIQSATQHAWTVDEQKGYTKVAGDYYARALASPLGQRVRAFYTTTSKQILDIHEEARRITDEHKPSQ